MIDFKKINFKMVSINRKHKIAAVILLSVIVLMLVLNSALAKRPILSFSSRKVQSTKKIVKNVKPADKKKKIADANQIADSNRPAKSAKAVNLDVSPTAKTRKATSTGKTAVKKTSKIDSNSISDSNSAVGTHKKSAKGSKTAVKKAVVEDNNQIADTNTSPSPTKNEFAPVIVTDANGNVYVDVNSLMDSNNKTADSDIVADSNSHITEVNKPTDSNIMVVEVNSIISPPQVKTEPAELTANLSAIQSGIQSMVFIRNMPRIDALQLLAGRYNKNIVPTSKVSGTLNFTRLNNVSFEDAMTAILGSEYEYKQQGNIIKVYASGEYQNSEMVCKVFTLYYITAAEAKKMIIPVMSKDGKIEVTTAAQTGVPVDESITAPSGGGDALAINDMLVMYDYPDRVAKAEQIIAAIDVKPKQVLIEATILTATLTDDMQLGIDWRNLKRSIVDDLSDITYGTSDFFGFGGSSTKVGDSSLTGGITIGVIEDDVAAFIRAVESVTDVTILANPKILATNKQLGQVYIGKKVAYQSEITQNQTGSTTQQVEFLETGTKLSFRPYIGDDGYIRMDIHPKDSSYSIRNIGTNTSVPDETSAEIVTNIVVKDGETIVIGGLFRDKVQTAKTQVPVLGNIPIIGAAFSSHADEAKREEVMVLLTPHIIGEPNKADGAERAEDIGRKIAGAKDELSPSRMKLAQQHYEKAAVYYVGGKNREALKELNNALELYPGYIEALQLEEKIYNETDPKKKPVRKIVDKVEKAKSDKWRRR